MDIIWILDINLINLHANLRNKKCFKVLCYQYLKCKYN